MHPNNPVIVSAEALIPRLEAQCEENRVRLEEAQKAYDHSKAELDIAIAAKALAEKYATIVSYKVVVPVMPPPKPAPQTVSSTYGAVSSAVKSAIDRCPVDYTIHDIAVLLKADGVDMKNEAISQTMSRFASEGKVTVKVKGAGKKPTVYTQDLILANPELPPSEGGASV